MEKRKRKRPYRLFPGKVLTGIITSMAHYRSFRRFGLLPSVEQFENGLPHKFGWSALRKKRESSSDLNFYFGNKKATFIDRKIAV